jgi:cytochrome c553
MRKFTALAVAVLISLIATGILSADTSALSWAFLVPPPGLKAIPDDGTIHHLAGSDGGFTLTQIRNSFGSTDWYPGDHPPMPSVVANGRKPDVQACAFCHYPNGKGRPENASPAGMPAAYLLQQLMDFRNDLRKSSEPLKANVPMMIKIAKGMTDEEMKQVADYYSSMKWTPYVKVIEADTIPKIGVQGLMYVKLPGTETEPLGSRIIEVPDDTDATELFRNPRSGYTAYAPVGSIKKGEALATTGGAGKTFQCAICHGPGLKGLGPIPHLAGRSPSYIARQLYDFQTGARNGDGSKLMKPVVANLTTDDITVLAAYVASLEP